MNTMSSTRTTPIIDANSTPQIGDLVPGVVVFRWSMRRMATMISELPCHHDQIVSVIYHEGARSVIVDQPVVCRRCGAGYAATPIPATKEMPRGRIVYRMTGTVGISRQRRPIDRF